MKNNKLFILLPDGVGLRNFAFTQFYDIGISLGFDIVYWNNTVFDIKSLGFKEHKITESRIHPFTDILKNAVIQIGLNQFVKRTGDTVYNTYRFYSKDSSFKQKLKRIGTERLIKTFDSESGLAAIRRKMQQSERKTTYYKTSLATLKHEQPAFVFCTNQRPASAIAPLLAAKDLGIPTATFIFSWDNLPKATMIVETDYYFVWSDFMKKELLFYYPYIKPQQVLITGTPQFEPHFDQSLLIDKASFCNQYQLDFSKKYICFSGDDITTSPDDEQYLEDVSEAVSTLNEKGANLGIIFRRCPVDFSDRYDKALQKYSHIITPINPLWSQSGDTWNTVMPTAADLKLQVNIIANCEMVINMASSMVFDFAVFNKPCLYINYDKEVKKRRDWSSQTIYNFIHFRSMPNKDTVIWLTSKSEIASKITMALNEQQKYAGNAARWFETINAHSPQEASSRILKGIHQIINQNEL